MTIDQNEAPKRHVHEWVQFGWHHAVDWCKVCGTIKTRGDTGRMIYRKPSVSPCEADKRD